MKKIALYFTVFCCILLSACDIHINTGSSVTRGNNPNVETTEVEFNVTNFKGIDAYSIFDIQVVKSNTPSVKITIDKSLEKILDVQVTNGILELGLHKGRHTINVLKAVICMPDLQSVELSGACNVKSSDTFMPQRFKAELNGSSSLDLKLQTALAKFDLSGASHADLFMESKDIAIDASGSCNLHMNGSANNLKISSSGACRIDGLNLKVSDVDIESSGSSNITLQVENKLSADASGASTIRYIGKPVVNIETSGSSSVKPQ